MMRPRVDVTFTEFMKISIDERPLTCYLYSFLGRGFAHGLRGFRRLDGSRPPALILPANSIFRAEVYREVLMVTVRRFLSILVLISIISALLAAQGTVESGSRVRRTSYPVEWPTGPSRSSVPDWAKTGLIRFSRWDGGRIETAKAALSGWPGFWPPDPNVLYATTNWYDRKTIRFLRDAGINMVWVTFSNGFSNKTEQLQQEQLAGYIAECHRQGIHVMAYESIANMFWQDMYKHVPESRNWKAIGKNGKPVPYGAGEYKRVGYVSRYMANLDNPQWLAYLRKRIDLAIDAGADGVIYDNNFAPNLTSLTNVYRMIYHYGASRKKDFLLMGNFHNNTYALNRLTNCMTTEDGWEPGIYDDAHSGPVPAKQYALRTGKGLLVDNIGLFRLLDSLSGGWKPDLVEDGRREYGTRETRQMSAARLQLALAEARSFHVAEEMFVEDAFATAVWNNNSQAMAALRAAGVYNRFFATHTEYYLGTKSLAPVAVVLDDSSGGVGLLNGLGARNVLFDVVYERDLASTRLSRYSAVAVITAPVVGDSGLARLEKYVSNGGKLFVAGDSASTDEKGNPRTRPTFFGAKLGKGECTYFDRLPSVDKLAEILKATEGTRIPRLEAPAGIVYNVVEQPNNGEMLVHLLNYTGTPGEKFTILLHRKYGSATLVSPDMRTPIQVLQRQASGGYEVAVPRLNTYAVLVLAR